MRPTTRTPTLVLALGVASGLAACSPEINPLEQRVVGQPDQPRTASIEVDEMRIATRYEGDAAIVSVPVRALTGEGQPGEVSVSLTTLTDTLGAVAVAKFTTSKAEQLVEVTLPQAPKPATQPEQVGLLVRWAATVGKEQAYGARSLYHTTRHFGVQLWAPVQVDAGATTAVRVWVRDLDGKLLPDVPVTVAGVTGMTDLAGQAEFSVAMPADAASYTLAASAVVDGLREEVTHTLAVVPASAPRLFLSTDKPLYRPGQTIHIRALALAKKDRKPLANAPITLELKDGKGTKIFKEEAATDAYGVASLTAPLASQVNVGDYVVRAVVGELEVERVVKVSEEKLPKFAVQATFDQPWFAPGEALEGAVSARYFYGKPVIQGTVKVSIQGRAFEAGSVFTGKTNDEGLLAFELPGQGAAGTVPLVIEVVDTAGFSVLATAAARIAEPQLSVGIIPESLSIPAGQGWQAYVLTRGALGEPAEATCTTVGAGGAFLGNEPSFSTGAAGIAVIDAGSAEIHVKCTSASGLSGSASRTVASGPTSVLIRPAKALYAAGEAVKLDLFAPVGEPRLYVDRIHRGRIIESLEVPLSNGQGTLVTRPAPGEDGTLTFTAYYVAADGTVATGERFVYVQPPLAKVSVSASQETFLPGAEATLTFQVTDQVGNGQAAAVGVTIADEAVFALAGGVGPDEVAGYFLLADEPDAVKPFALTQDRSALQVAAAAALAEIPTGASTTAPGQSLASLQDAVKVTSWAALDEVRALLIEDVQGGVKRKVITRDNAGAEIEGVRIYDFWGKQIELEVITGGWSSCYSYASVTMFSCGSDELKGTWDDYTSVFSVDLVNEACDDQRAYAAGAGAGADASTGWYPPSPNTADYDESVPQDPSEGGGKAASSEVKKRDEFPETLYVNPALITDGSGKAQVTLPLADAITEWRVSMIANSASGLVGGNTGGITVFQPFFVDTDLPRKLTQNDQIDLPIAVFNYGEEDVEVQLTVTEASWFELLGQAKQTIAVPKGQSLAVPVRIKAVKPGTHSFEVTAVTADFGDGVVRTVDVAPDGQKFEVSQSGPLESTLALTATYPQNALEGGSDLLLKLMGGPSAQMVDGMDALISVPQGCFEPMMNSTWIDALVIDYLGWTGSQNQELVAQARGALDSGVQQCATFECTGGGFTWFGNPDPAHPILTAFGLMMFEDIATLRDVDAGQVTRAAEKLTALQQPSGGWITHEGTKNQLVPWDELRTTCVVAWGLASTKYAPESTLASAVAHIHAALSLEADTYTLAMCANALLKSAPDDPDTDSVVAEILERVHHEGELAWWDSGSPGVSLVEGQVATVETTALATQALYKLSSPPVLVEGALKFLAGKKSPDGNFLSTQGTIQSLRAFVAAAKYGTTEVDATVTVTAAGQVVTPKGVQIDESNREVVHLIDLSAFPKAGGVPVTLQFAGTGTMYYQLVQTYYTAHEDLPEPVENKLVVDLAYDLTTAQVGQAITATVRAKAKKSIGPGDMPMVEFLVPPGFDADLGALDAKVASDMNVARYEVKGSKVVIYLHNLAPEADPGFEVEIPLQARFPMQVSAPGARAWIFFEPDHMSESAPVQLVITAASGAGTP